LAVTLDDVGWPDLGGVGLMPELAPGPALAEEVPTLVERDLHLLETLALVRAQPGELVTEAILLRDQLTDPGQDLSVLGHCMLLSPPHLGRSHGERNPNRLRRCQTGIDA
jgi:hypothetical protein